MNGLEVAELGVMPLLQKTLLNPEPGLALAAPHMDTEDDGDDQLAATVSCKCIGR